MTFTGNPVTHVKEEHDEKRQIQKERIHSRRPCGPIDSAKIEQSVRALLSKGISRRGFMQLAAGTGVMLGVDHIFRDCGTADAGTRRESRTCYFRPFPR